MKKKNAKNINKLFFDIIDNLSKEKKIEKKLIIEAFKNAVIKVFEREYSDELTIELIVDEEKKDIKLLYNLVVVDVVDDELLQISQKEAMKLSKSKTKIELGTMFKKEKNLSDLPRYFINFIVTFFKKKLIEFEKEEVYNYYIEKKGQIINGLVVEKTRNNIFVEIPKTTAFCLKKEQIVNENLIIGKHVKFYVLDAYKNNLYGQVALSRAHPNFLKLLFEIEIPEISSKLIDILTIVRIPGIRSKVVVKSNNKNIDPVGACIGKKGVRIKVISKELNNEKIDVIKWSNDYYTFIMNCFLPFKTVHLSIDLKTKSCFIILFSTKIKQIIGKNPIFLKLILKIIKLSKVNVVSYFEYIKTHKPTDFEWNGNITKSEIENENNIYLSNEKEEK